MLTPRVSSIGTRTADCQLSVGWSLTWKRCCIQSGRLKGSGHEARVRGSVAGCRREMTDLDDCSWQGQMEIVESTLAELQHCTAAPANFSACE